MIDGIEGSAEVEEDENGERTRVGRAEDVIGDLEESCFCAVVTTEARLEGFIEVIVVEVGFELGGNDSLKYFGEKGEVGDGPIVIGGIGVETRFLENGGYGSHLEGRRDKAR